jgi:hypothetical protein
LVEWIILASASIAALGLIAAAIVWRLGSYACPSCGSRRSWSTGIPPWRCRRCGMLFTPGQPTAAAQHMTPARQPAASVKSGSDYKFKAGQIVRILPDRQEREGNGENRSFRVMRLLPSERGMNQYRIKSTEDGHERVVRENEVA